MTHENAPVSTDSKDGGYYSDPGYEAPCAREPRRAADFAKAKPVVAKSLAPEEVKNRGLASDAEYFR